MLAIIMLSSRMMSVTEPNDIILSVIMPSDTIKQIIISVIMLRVVYATCYK